MNFKRNTPIKILLIAPIVDLWITLVQVFKSKIFLFIVTGIGFLYTWTFWTFSMLAFSEETSFTFLDYFWSYMMLLIPNIGLLFALFPFPKICKWVAFFPLIITSWLYTNMILNQTSYIEFSIIGFGTNIGAFILILLSIKEVKNDQTSK
jgi:hypothetical protein